MLLSTVCPACLSSVVSSVKNTTKNAMLLCRIEDIQYQFPRIIWSHIHSRYSVPASRNEGKTLIEKVGSTDSSCVVRVNLCHRRSTKVPLTTKRMLKWGVTGTKPCNLRTSSDLLVPQTFGIITNAASFFFSRSLFRPKMSKGGCTREPEIQDHSRSITCGLFDQYKSFAGRDLHCYDCYEFITS
jgi:hypothetical protein